MEDQNGCHSEMITGLLCYKKSSPHDVAVKGDIFRRTIHPPSLAAIAFIFWELRRIPPQHAPVVEEQKKPSLNRVKMVGFESH